MTNRPRTTTLVGLVVVLVCVAYFVSYVARHVDSLPPMDWWDPTVWVVLGGTVLLHLASMFLLAIGWVILLDGLDTRIAFGPALGAVYSSQIAKYLPSNVLHFVGRVALAQQFGASLAASSASLVFEIVWVVGTGGLVTLAWFATGGVPAGFVESGASWVSLLLVVPVALAMWPPIVRRMAVLAGDRIPRLSPLAEAPLPGFRALLPCLGLYLGTYTFMGLSLYLLAGLFLQGPSSLSLGGFIGLGGAAWLVGFVTPGSPGGLGVREALLVAFLAPDLGAGVAIGTTLSFRGVSVVADGLAFVVGSPLVAQAMSHGPKPAGEDDTAPATPRGEEP